MFARYFLIIIGIVSVFWIGYVAADIIETRESLSPWSVFGKEDKEILVINRKDELSYDLSGFQTTESNRKLLGKLVDQLEGERSIYISRTRNHIMIEGRHPWSRKKVKELLNRSGLKVGSERLRSFNTDGYTVTFLRHYLYFTDKNYESVNVEEWKGFDRKASGALIQFETESTTISDIYVKPGGIMEFQSKNNLRLKGRRIDDAEVFAPALPGNLKGYHFFERDYKKSVDEIYRSGPMSSWSENGFVEVAFKGKLAIISDYIEGQDPLLVLYELAGKDPENEEHDHFTDIRLTHGFPSNEKNGFYAYKMNNFVVLSDEESVCEEIVAAYKLGNTLSAESELYASIFGKLPKKVSERNYDGGAHYSKTIYRDRILQTSLSVEEQEITTAEDLTPESFTMHVDDNVRDFLTEEGNGNAIALGSGGKVILFRGGKKAWERRVNGRTIGEIRSIRLTKEGVKIYVITGSSKIFAFRENGDILPGFPVDLKGRTVTASATLFSHRNREMIVVPCSNGEILTLSTNGTILSSFTSKLSDIKNPVDVWVSQGKLFYGVRNSNQFAMYEADRKREYRSFQIQGPGYTAIMENELKLFARGDGAVCYFDQKGVRNDGSINGEVYHVTDGKTDVIAVHTSRGLEFLDAGLSPLGIAAIDFSDVQYVAAGRGLRGTVISVIDGLENNVYLYLLTGDRITEKRIEGSQKCTVHNVNGQIRVTTIVDDYLIQYTID